jgi:hypothetical protein
VHDHVNVHVDVHVIVDVVGFFVTISYVRHASWAFIRLPAGLSELLRDLLDHSDLVLLSRADFVVNLVHQFLNQADPKATRLALCCEFLQLLARYLDRLPAVDRKPESSRRVNSGIKPEESTPGEQAKERKS